RSSAAPAIRAPSTSPPRSSGGASSALVPRLRGQRGDVGAGPLPERRVVDREPAAARDQLEQGPVHPVDHRAVVLAGAVEPGPVLLAAGQEQGVALYPAVRVEQRQRPGEAAERAVAD